MLQEIILNSDLDPVYAVRALKSELENLSSLFQHFSITCDNQIIAKFLEDVTTDLRINSGKLSQLLFLVDVKEEYRYNEGIQRGKQIINNVEV